ncbi:uncharacterized protein N7443_003515 [Penicillium atrosanguineum]|uniref:uncharacterized protein n=1 Tax=Penicillium atrosanguineum TaxID=1132637 RepID=UPI0023A17DCB|nr:uncharacterized protein N7443_003515 [Penicillium atrosanguineum]KAJ5303855.1 hypothetical protein N7443_003515 [Penicillium atrosanguineum]
MPPRLRSAFPRSLSRPLDSAGVFYCPSCSTWRRELTSRAGASTGIGKIGSARRSDRLLEPPTTITTRHFTTSSVITAGKAIPPRFKELHDALSRVQDAAIQEVSISRLQLALRGLESEAPLIRVAVLGLDNADSARKLVRLLLADPLSQRESWEDVLDGYDADPSRGLLIRYGDVSESIPNDLLPTLAVRSPVLKKGNIELLIGNIGSEAASTGTPSPPIPSSYPMSLSQHHTLVGKICLVGRSNLKNEIASVRGAIELSVANETRDSDRLSFVDIDRASIALDKIRESVQNATEYERGWNASGVQPVIDWLATFSQAASGEDLNPALVPLIESLLNAADEGVSARDAQALQEQTVGAVPEKVQSELERGVVSWAEQGHSELRSALEAGFASPRWRGLAWWKLFWRVDDVGMITSDILEKQFLRRAEREVIYNSGKYQQAGLLEEPTTSPETTTDSTLTKTTPPPWPTLIPDIRAKLLHTTVPSLQALAQSLVFFSVSTTTLTSALSVLTYLSVPSASAYESATLGALGLIYSLRRQQKKWDSAREFWEDEVREEGRTSLLETEALLRQIVREGGKSISDVSDHRAREAVVRARKALEAVRS